MSGAVQSAGDASTVKVSLLRRLRAWWEGYDISDAAADADSTQKDGKPATKKKGKLQQVQASPETRLDVRERIFGKGYHGPATDKVLLDVISPLGLDSSKSVVDFNGRLGSLSRVIVRECDAWVDFIEADELLLERASDVFKAEKLQKKVKIVGAALEDGDIKERSRDALISVEGLSRSENAGETLRQLQHVVKEGGHVIFIDVMLRGQSEDSPDLKLWTANEGKAASIMTIENARKLVKELELKMHVFEDITENYCKLIASRLETFRTSLKTDPIRPEFKTVALKEIDYWARRAEIMQNGDLGLFRIHASVPKKVQ